MKILTYIDLTKGKIKGKIREPEEKITIDLKLNHKCILCSDDFKEKNCHNCGWIDDDKLIRN